MMQVGNYSATLNKALMTHTKTSGKPQVELQFTVTHYANGSDWAEIAPQTAYIWLSMNGTVNPGKSKSGRQVTKEQLQSIGFPEKPEMIHDPETGEALLVLPDGIADDAIQLECYEDNYGGSATMKWRLKGGGAPRTVTEEDVLKFKSMWD